MTADELVSLFKNKDFHKAKAALDAEPKLARATSTVFNGATPLHHACCFLFKPAVLALLEHKPPLDLARPCDSDEAQTPLEFACNVGNDTQQLSDDRLEVARALLAAGAKVKPGLIARACGPRSQPLVELLLEHHAPIDGPELLLRAVEYDHPKLVAALLARPKPNVNETGGFPAGSTALHVAVKKRLVKYVELLIKAGANPDLKNSRGESPRDLAPQKLHALLDGGAAPAPAPAPKKSTLSSDAFASVWQAPHDFVRYAVLADALIERGETSRGEFVQLSILKKRSPEQDKRRQALLKKHRGEWLGEARPAVKTWVDSETEPGFVSHVTVAPEKFLGSFEPIRLLGPRLIVEWTKVPTRIVMKKLAALPLGTLYGLDLRNPEAFVSEGDTWVDDIGLDLLAPALAGLKSLSLTRLRNRFTGALLTHVSRGAGKTLEHLSLSHHELGDGWNDAKSLEKVSALTPANFPALQSLAVTGAGKAVKRVLSKAWGKKVTFLADAES